MPDARIAAVNLECSHPIELARFWARMLDGQIAVETPDFCAVSVGSLHLGATRSEHYLPPTWPSPERGQQIHLDLAVEDLEAAEGRAIELGAVKESAQPHHDRARVLRDPAGHPFCLRS